ncbi:TorA-specific chaperone [Rhodopseudomonas rhenobacensis]|uniref:TorA-specific chaperone n=1 Tax=Rhodopseudomonas rhenobacensis TaxID=87461 RepID=A0A7W7Z655_9BRAD|nr:molecular chaperone TorD family protein [Rhodopseudomonas rhenobacensis]MBB5048715.1 TorA-specific chaperone [Rhodopseudomonas rhenobacensis]
MNETLRFEASSREQLAQQFEDSRRNRVLCLEWLASVFAAPPGYDTVVSYRSCELALWLDQLALDPAFSAGIARMQAALDPALDDDTLTARLGIGFGRLFSGIRGRDCIPPYESAFRGDGRLFQVPTAEMEALLVVHNVVIAGGLAEPADHLSVELALLARLIAADHPAARDLQLRIARWVPDFCDTCIARDRLGFWAGAAMVLEAIIDHDARLMQAGARYFIPA